MEKLKQENIRNIIFDLGGVLLDLDFKAPVQAFRELGMNGDYFDYHHAINDQTFLEFETGRISPEEFRDRIRHILDEREVTDQAIDSAWCSMLLSVPQEKVALLKNLGTHFRLFLFSNTNAIHIDYFKKRFEAEHHLPFESLFEKSFYSHVIHDRKPVVSSFEKVLQMAGISREETLFIDDFGQNIAVAESYGLRVIHYLPGTDLASHFHGYPAE